MSNWNSSTLATSCEELTHWKRPWRWEGLGAGGEGDNGRWDGWMASLTRWAWVWVWEFESWWWTGRPGVLRFMGWQRVQTERLNSSIYYYWLHNVTLYRYNNLCNHFLIVELFIYFLPMIKYILMQQIMCTQSQVRLFATPWTIASQSSLSMGFFRQGYWSGLPLPPPGDLPDPGMDLLHWPADSLPLSHLGSLVQQITFVKLCMYLPCFLRIESSIQSDHYFPKKKNFTKVCSHQFPLCESTCVTVFFVHVETYPAKEK